MQDFRHDPAGLGRGYPIIGNNSAQFSYADAVYIDLDGFLALSSTTNKIHGYYVGAGETMASDNETVAKKCPDYVYAQDVEMIYGSDQACTQTDIGTYADFGTATTGAFELNLAGGATGQFLILGFDPEGEGDTDVVVVVAAEIQKAAFAQS